MNDMELDVVAGGCDHEHTNITGRKQYEITPGKNDWGYHVKKLPVYKCLDCGEVFYRDSNGNVVALSQ